MKLTKDAVAALTLPEGKADHFVWDDTLPGFGVRLRGRAKRWVVQYRVGAQQRRESLGDVRKIGIEDARRIARNRFAQAELGTDPAAEKAKAREAARAAKLTLGNVAARYLDAKADRLRPNTYRQAKLHLEVFWSPLRSRSLGEIKRVDVATRLQEIIKERGRTAAARARGNLSALFSWSMKEGLCEHNPVIATNDPAEGIQPRDRVLSDRELGLIWNACPDDDFGRIVKLLILTGCRREEIGALKWSEIDGEAITIPASRTKNHKAHALPLPPLVLKILAAAPRRPRRDFIFGGGAGGFNAWSYSTMALRARVTATEDRSLPSWTLHDLRRTFRTGLGRLGVAPHVAELCINHRKNGVEAIYDRHRYEREIKAALALWSDHVAAIVEGREGSNVTPLWRGA
jgi:integrase